MQIPKTTPTAIRKGHSGIAVWSLQRALRGLSSPSLPEDGEFGETTLAAVKRYQSTRSLTPDGIAGPATQARLARSLIALADPTYILPKGLAKSIVEGESGNYIAAVNWNSPGGVDCGYVQRRVYDPPSETAIKRAFDSRHQLELLRTRLKGLYTLYRQRKNPIEYAWRLAVLAHNYPYAAELLSKTDVSQLSSYWTTPQKWVIEIGAHFDDGHAVQTPLEWCRFYSTGSVPHKHKGRMVRYVTSWA